jgi:hypothetical protein
MSALFVLNLYGNVVEFNQRKRAKLADDVIDLTTSDRSSDEDDEQSDNYASESESLDEFPQSSVQDTSATGPFGASNVPQSSVQDTSATGPFGASNVPESAAQEDTTGQYSSAGHTPFAEELLSYEEMFGLF